MRCVVVHYAVKEGYGGRMGSVKPVVSFFLFPIFSHSLCVFTFLRSQMVFLSIYESIAVVKTCPSLIFQCSFQEPVWNLFQVWNRFQIFLGRTDLEQVLALEPILLRTSSTKFSEPEFRFLQEPVRNRNQNLKIGSGEKGSGHWVFPSIPR